jgi:hypothetical protein
MKKNKKINLIAILCLSLMLVSILVAQGSFFSKTKGESGDDEAITNVISNSLIIFQDVGNHDIKDSSDKAMKTGKTSDLTLTQKDLIKSNYNEKLDKYLSKDSYFKKKMKDTQDKVLNNNIGVVSNVIESGVFSLSYKSKDINEDNKSAKVVATAVIWQKFITEIAPGKFKVVFPVGKLDVACNLVKEDGEWKAVDLDISNYNMGGDIQKEKEFGSYEEALQYANQVVPNNVF